ncbi:MAG: hypothetical protein E7485_01495 [Ruminococcaceae bacterium]|nr:hypothetical protein [Oscillospiraceae bacterium]
MNSRKTTAVMTAAILAMTAGMSSFAATRPTADEINDSSIIIGTYLIDFEALNEENQALAEKNASDTNQHKIYYKSELNNGVWYDITTAENVGDISSSEDLAVSDSLIDSLELTLHFRADGSIVDLKTGEIVNMLELSGSVDPSTWTQMSALVQQRDMTDKLLEEIDDDELQEIYKVEDSAIAAVLDYISDDTTKELLNTLNSLDSVINASADAAEKDMVVSLKMKKKAQLDIVCYDIVSERIDEQIAVLTKHDRSAHAELIRILSDCQSALKEAATDSASSAGASASDGPTDSTERKQQELEEKIIAAAQGGDTAAALEAAFGLATLEAMINGTSGDAELAAQLADDMLNDTMDSISEQVSDILNGSDVSTGTAAALRSAIADAQSYAKDAAYYKTGSVISEEYNALLNDSLTELGELLEALSSDGLPDDILDVLTEGADDTLDQAAQAEALSRAPSDAQKAIDKLNAQADDKYEQYLQALDKGDSELAEKLNAELDALLEQLDRLRSSAAAELGALYAQLAELKKQQLSDDSSQLKEKIRDVESDISAQSEMMSDVDKALLEQLDASLDAISDAAKSGSESQTETAYDDLKDALKNIPSDILDGNLKADILGYIAALCADNPALADDIIGDISDAKNGKLEPDSGSSDSSFDPDSILDITGEYKLMIPSYNIYSNTMSVQRGKTVYIDVEELAVEIGAQYITSGRVYVFKADGILIEFTPGDNRAYVKDKLFALAEVPYVSGGKLYVPCELIAAGLGMETFTEEDCVYLR